MGHTWRHARPNDIDKRHRIYSGDNLVAVIDPNWGAEHVEDHAAKAAAAPAMYEALKEAAVQIRYLHAKFQPTGTGMSVLHTIDAALLSAEGGQPS